MFFRKWIPLCATAYVALHPFAIGKTSLDDAVRMNQIQVIGSHNSYHSGIAPSEAKLMSEKNPIRYAAFEYKHRPLDQQFSSGIRQIELDVYADSEGGRYANPLGPRAVAAAGLPPDPDFGPQGLMNRKRTLSPS
jgi:Phosphoinositide phospholipase C, Ca2+-dependent